MQLSTASSGLVTPTNTTHLRPAASVRAPLCSHRARCLSSDSGERVDWSSGSPQPISTAAYRRAAVPAGPKPSLLSRVAQDSLIVEQTLSNLAAEATLVAEARAAQDSLIVSSIGPSIYSQLHQAETRAAQDSLRVAAAATSLGERAAQDSAILEKQLTSISEQAEARAAQDSRILSKRAKQDSIILRHLLRQGTQRAEDDIHKPAGMILLPTWLMGAVAGVAHLPGSHLVPVAAGAAIGTIFVLLNKYYQVHMHISPPHALGVVLTGGSKGLGKALAREMLMGGDRVLFTSRTQAGVDAAVTQLRVELGPDTKVYGVVCDVSEPKDVVRLREEAVRLLGTVDVWINNAGFSGSFQSFVDTPVHHIEQVVRTNLLGTAYCSREAARLFASQPKGGHLFNVDGAGADGIATPNYAAYGATKAGIRHLSMSLQKELEGSSIHAHLLSPGMILTDLLLAGATPANKQAFNILCEQPETTAAFLGPRIRTIVARGLRDTYTKYLTPTSALWRVLTAPSRVGRYFDAEGNRVYPEEDTERLYGRKSKVASRALLQARVQDTGLQLAYSLSLAVAVAAVLIDASVSGSVA